MSAAFTPGPWFDDGPLIFAGLSRRTGKIAEVSIAYKDSKTYAANVRLIRAAPELYAACEEALRFVAMIEAREDTHYLVGGNLAAALAKVSGDGQ